MNQPIEPVKKFNLRDRKPQPTMCHLCQLPVAANECPDCGSIVVHYTSMPTDLPQPLDSPGSHESTATIDDARPDPGPISHLYERWQGKHVTLHKVNKKGEKGETYGKGTVIGVDLCPSYTNIEGEYLWVRLDKPNHLGEVLICRPLTEIQEV